MALRRTDYIIRLIKITHLYSSNWLSAAVAFAVTAVDGVLLNTVLSLSGRSTAYVVVGATFFTSATDPFSSEKIGYFQKKNVAYLENYETYKNVCLPSAMVSISYSLSSSFVSINNHRLLLIVSLPLFRWLFTPLAALCFVFCVFFFCLFVFCCLTPDIEEK